MKNVIAKLPNYLLLNLHEKLSSKRRVKYDIYANVIEVIAKENMLNHEH